MCTRTDGSIHFNIEAVKVGIDSSGEHLVPYALSLQYGKHTHRYTKKHSSDLLYDLYWRIIMLNPIAKWVLKIVIQISIRQIKSK